MDENHDSVIASRFHSMYGRVEDDFEAAIVFRRIPYGLKGDGVQPVAIVTDGDDMALEQAMVFFPDFKIGQRTNVFIRVAAGSLILGIKAVAGSEGRRKHRDNDPDCRKY
jgi:hypothetical protein